MPFRAHHAVVVLAAVVAALTVPASRASAQLMPPGYSHGCPLVKPDTVERVFGDAAGIYRGGHIAGASDPMFGRLPSAMMTACIYRRYPDILSIIDYDFTTAAAASSGFTGAVREIPGATVRTAGGARIAEATGRSVVMRGDRVILVHWDTIERDKSVSHRMHPASVLGSTLTPIGTMIVCGEKGC